MADREEFIVWRTARPKELLYNGKVVPLPDNWALVKSGDAGLTRRLKSCGAPYWVLVHKRRNRIENLGLFMDKDTAAAVKAELDAERETTEYQKQPAQQRRRSSPGCPGSRPARRKEQSPRPERRYGCPY